jgi:hypothetical protein
MSQSDLTWPGSQSLSVSRTVIIEALRALASNSSGASAPTTTFAFQFWYDETANALKMRNAANTAWITLFTFDQSGGTWAVSGDLVLPEKIVHAGDPDTWISLTTDTITLRTAGTDRLTVGSDGVVTLANGLDVEGAGEIVSLVAPNATSNFMGFRDATGRKGLVGYGDGTDAMRVANERNAELSFRTNNTRRVTIAANGNVGIDNASPSYRLDVNGSGQITGDFYSVGIFNNTTANAANLWISSLGRFSRSTSSKRSKADIETADLSYSQAAVYGVRPVWYRSLCEADNPAWSWWGFIAEEVAEIDPRLVQWGQDADGNPQAEGVAYDRFVPHLCAVVTEQRDMIAALEARIAALEGKG